MQAYLYLEAIGEDRFSNTFGIPIFEEVRKSLKTRNGYIVNKPLAALRLCKMWDIADSITKDEQEEFAEELVDSLCSNNSETMNLLSFSNLNEIPEHWSEIILNVWTDKLVSNNLVKECFPTYINQYLGLIHCHNTKKAISYGRTKEGIEILDKSISSRPTTINQLKELEKDNIEVWDFLLKILMENQDTINCEELKEMVKQQGS